MDKCQKHGPAYCKKKKKKKKEQGQSLLFATRQLYFRPLFPLSVIAFPAYLKEQIPVRHWMLTQCPLARCSDEDGSYRHLYSQFWADRLSNCLFYSSKTDTPELEC